MQEARRLSIRIVWVAIDAVVTVNARYFRGWQVERYLVRSNIRHLRTATGHLQANMLAE